MQAVLTGGFYQAKSLIAGAQRCLNLFPEKNEEGAPFPFTYYLTPGLTSLLTQSGECRCLYRASDGNLFAVYGTTVYYISSAMVATSLGTIGTTDSIVSMSDNRLVLLLVDGSSTGYYIDMTTRTMRTIVASAFYGADRVDYLDTFFVLNRPNTNQWYISASELNTALLLGGGVTGGAIAGGAAYTDGTHAAVALTGGSGTGAIATVTVAGNVVTAVTITSEGASYIVGNVLTASALDLGGAITGSGIATPGTAYTAGGYTGVPLTGGTGTGALASITVLGGIVTVATVTTAGVGYRVGDQLSVGAVNVGGTGSGFVLLVSAVDTAGTGFTYTVTSIDQGNAAFDPLDIAAKVGGSDSLVSIIVMHREIWLIGALTSEVWYNSGAADFTFQAMPGVFIEHGCVAKYSVCKADLTVFWLGQDLQGHMIVFGGAQYNAKRISTHALENALQTYGDVSDAIGFTYQQEGHTFYQLTFPTADRTWVYDMATELWHERAWIDTNGSEHRHRANCAAFAYGKNLVGDFENGRLYLLDVDAITELDGPMMRRKGFPCMIADGDRVTYRQFVAVMQVGDAPGTTVETEPQVSLRYSDDFGYTYGNPIFLGSGQAGAYIRQMQAQQLGMARSRVWELFWSIPYKTALMGGYVDYTVLGT